MRRRWLIRLFISGGLALALFQNDIHAAEPPQDPLNPGKVIEPLPPVTTPPSESQPSSEPTESSEPQPSPTPASEEKKPEGHKKPNHKKRFLSDLFEATPATALNPDSSGGGSPDGESRAFLAEVAVRLAGKVLIAK